MDNLIRQHQTSDRPFLRDTYRQPLAVFEPIKTLFERIAARDRSAATECLATYGNLIWALAKSNTRSFQEAEHVTECVFEDIWNGAGSKLKNIPEREAIEQIAVRCIYRCRFEDKNVF